MLLLVHMVMRKAVIAVSAGGTCMYMHFRHTRILTSTEYCLYFYILDNNELPGGECTRSSQFTFS